ncbi:hypothetical protein EV702DRAFT_1070371 [Suillus placidus]|uniref:Uncharacterized protein n=1 Tax=Suillus placidus TaxID=48579 RepID=A0A9P7A491_9AGAM|nr:hypothetical protein EV702DRAFT_1070371 [Suillus placidus]
MAALVSPACPFQTPISTILRIMRIHRVLRPVVKLVPRYVQQLVALVHDALHRLLGTLRSSWTELSDDPALAVRSFVRRCLQPLFGALRRIAPRLRSLVLRTQTRVVDSEARPPDQNLDVVATNQCLLRLKLPDTPTSSLEAPSIKWLLETSTDPEVFRAAASLVSRVDWPLDLDVSDTLRQLYVVYTSCLDVQKRIIPSLEEKASACIMTFCHLYCNRILQGHPAYGSVVQGFADCLMLDGMWGRTKVDDNMLLVTSNLLVAKYELYLWRPLPTFEACPDPVLEWLSRILPFYFVIGRVKKDVEKLAMTVISKLLCSPSSPSPQIIANCTLLACVMVGVQFDKKDIVRVDKSSALPQLAESLWAQFQKVLWGSDEGDLDRARRAWLLDVICRVLDRDLPGLLLPDRRLPNLLQPNILQPEKIWSLGMCRKIYSRARSFEQTDRDSSALLLKVQRFRFTVNPSFGIRNPPAPTDPAWLWYCQILWQDNSHSPEDFDWLVDYLGDICSNDHKTAGDILVLLSSMTVSCSPAKQRLYIERLIACMGSSMPPRLRHAALRAAHRSREVLASINVVDDADAVLTKLSPAILTAVGSQPGTTPTDYADRLFHRDRDLCYLELVFTLARNSVWHPHLFGGGHIDWCSIIAKSYDYGFIYEMYAFYLAGIFLRTTPKQVSVPSLSSITEQQWWDMMRKAWCVDDDRVISNAHCVEFLPVLVEGTKKYMSVALKPDLELLIRDVDDIIKRLKRRGSLEQREVTVAVEKLRGVVNEELAKFI